MKQQFTVGQLREILAAGYDEILIENDDGLFEVEFTPAGNYLAISCGERVFIQPPDRKCLILEMRGSVCN